MNLSLLAMRYSRGSHLYGKPSFMIPNGNNNKDDDVDSDNDDKIIAIRECQDTHGIHPLFN